LEKIKLVIMMSDEWIEASKKILEQINKLSNKKDRDRLDLVQAMRFSLYALHRSLLGWMNWVNNPDIMASFKKEELDNMNQKIRKYVEKFLNYDIEATQKGAEKSIKIREARQIKDGKSRRRAEDPFYI
jgi:hypothetical protein